MEILKALTDNSGKITVGAVIEELKSKRDSQLPDVDIVIKQLDPKKHDVFDDRKRPDKPVRIQEHEKGLYPDVYSAKLVTETGEETAWFRKEPVARVAIAIQKLIVKRAVSFVFGNPVTLSCSPQSENEKKIFAALKDVMYDIKEKSHNRKLARALFSCTEVAEIWYTVDDENDTLGLGGTKKLRCSIFSPLNGDKLYPYFDETGDMIAFSREFSVSVGTKTIAYFETYTDKAHYMWMIDGSVYKPVEGYPKELTIGKIPVIYAKESQSEWEDVQNIIDRLEKLLSNFADTNDYHASPKIFVRGELQGFAKKGESGAILQGDPESDAKYLSWENAPESVKLEIETLLRLIYTMTQTPDISFDAVKGIGNISGVALKLLFMDAHLKVEDHREVLDEYLQRRINVVKAFIGEIATTLKKEAMRLRVEPVITPYILRDEASEIKIWTDANGGEPVMSQKASFMGAAMTSDPEADYKQYQAEQDAATARQNSFAINEPTQA